jgi:7-carboxy-7-deazaguanine synthase
MPEFENDLLTEAGYSLPLMEHFYTIQGEGVHSGMPAYFLRLGGCNVGCVWCDVKDSWDASHFKRVAVSKMTEWVIQSGAKNAVITGGEPSLYPLGALIHSLRAAGISVWIETAGTNPMTTRPDWICVSPKKFKPVLPEWLTLADELKIVVNHKSDIDWAVNLSKQVKNNCVKILQPEWERSTKMLPLIIDFVKSNPDWRISLQTHKFMQIP